MSRTYDTTALQRMISEEAQAEALLADLKDLDELAPEDEDPEDIDQWEIALSFDITDVPFIIDELEEVADGES